MDVAALVGSAGEKRAELEAQLRAVHREVREARCDAKTGATVRDETFAGRDCDVLCLCAVGRQYRQDYTRRAVELLRPRVVVPCHWDDFTLPYDAAPRQLPGVDVEAFVEEIRAAGAAAVVLGLGQSWRF